MFRCLCATVYIRWCRGRAAAAGWCWLHVVDSEVGSSWVWAVRELWSVSISRQPSLRLVLTAAQVSSARPNYSYLDNLLPEYQPTKRLPSSAADLLHQPPRYLLLHSRLVPSPLLLPLSGINSSANTRSTSTLGTLKSRLKTELFTSAYRTYDRSAPTQRFWFTVYVTLLLACVISNCFQIRLYLDYIPAGQSIQSISDAQSVGLRLSRYGSILTADHLQATLSKLLTYCVLRSTQPLTLSGIVNE